MLDRLHLYRTSTLMILKCIHPPRVVSTCSSGAIRSSKSSWRTLRRLWGSLAITTWWLYLLSHAAPLMENVSWICGQDQLSANVHEMSIVCVLCLCPFVSLSTCPLCFTRISYIFPEVHSIIFFNLPWVSSFVPSAISDWCVSNGQRGCSLAMVLCHTYLLHWAEDGIDNNCSPKEILEELAA